MKQIGARQVAAGWAGRHAAVLSPVVVTLVLLLGASPASSQSSWVGWSKLSTLAVHNNATTALPAGYTVQLVLDTASLFDQGLLRDDCYDLRVSYVGGGGDVELDRLVENPHTATTTLTFRTQAAIGIGASDTGYRLHYGNSSAGSPPAAPGNVYAFYDDFQDGDAAGWTTKGTWSVVADGSNYIYRYTGGGATWALAYVPMAGLADIDYVVKIRAAANTNWIGSAFRIQDTSNFMTFYESKDVGTFKLARIVGDNHLVQGATPAFVMASGTWYRLHLRAIGSSVRARIWQDGTTEPTDWPIDRSDITYQSATNIGATLYNHTTAADWDEFKVRRLVGVEPTVTVLADAYTLTVETVGSGSVARDPDLPTYHYGDVVQLRATAADGSTFAGWSGGLTGNPTTVTILGNTTVTARFTLNDAPWWNSAWAYRARVTVTNTSATDALGVGYSTRFTVDAASLIATGRLLESGADLRVVSFDGLTNTELDRVVEDAATGYKDVWFALARALDPSNQDNGYYVYYGNPSAGAAPANGSSVFMFYEDWEQGTAHWTGAGGLDPSSTGTMGLTTISSLEAVSPSNSQRFPQKAAGGDAFSGYIPVAANAGYAIGVWGKSATGAYVPVGVDPYNSAHVKGTEIWLWTNEWTVSSPWSRRSARFITPATAAFIKIKSEWWAEGPGSDPVYLDNLYLRHSVASEPSLALGVEESTLPGPTISDITDTGPVQLGAAAMVSATVATTGGTIDAVTLRLQTPEAHDYAMSLISGTSTSGTWQGSFTPTQGGTYTYRILAHSSLGRSTLSGTHSLTVTDTSPPQIALVSVVNPILVRNTQTLVVSVTDNGQLGAVTVTVDGTAHAMSAVGNQYTYAWRVTTVGTIAYTVQATDTGGNTASLAGTFESQAREVDVCTWRDGKAGAASWSIDDGNTSCLAELASAGIRGTYYTTGSGTQGWYATYSAAGHEIGAHTVGHPCDAPTCTPNCTPEGLWAIPYTETEVTAYRQGQIDPNIAAIEAGTGKPVVSMAWPCGCADARRMTSAGPYVLGVRGYYDYIAQLAWLEDVNEPTPVEFMDLNCSHSYTQTHIDRAIAEGKWAIVTSHGSCAGIDYIGSHQNVLWVAPVGEVLKYIKVRDAAQFSNYSRAGRTISFDARHNLGTFTRKQVDLTPLLSIVYDNPVTLKVHILDSDTVLGVKVDDVTVSYLVLNLDGTRYVTFDAALNTTRHVAVTLSKPTPVITQVADNGPVELGDPAQITASVTVAEGSVQDVKLHVTAPQAAEYAMTLVSGTTYAASFTPGQLGSYTYYVSAANDEGTPSQSTQHTFTVQDTSPPQWRALAQAHDVVAVGGANALSAEGLDAGGLQWAILATDESGAWHEFDWGGSDWWNHQWTKRRAVTIQEPAGLARTDELIDVPVSSVDFVGLTSCAAELRVADTDGHEVPCQVYDEQSGGGTVTCHLLFPADVTAGATRTYYIYYDNPTATPPAYSTDLTSTTAGGLLTISNTYLNLDLDIDSGIVSRVQLPAGTNTALPLSTEVNSYWGWHQVCSSLDGNITGKNSLCSGGTAPASGLVLTTAIDGPLLKVFEFTSQKSAATYRMTYRFVANAPYYQYDLAREGTTASVLNNFWYLNGNFTSLGMGSGGTPATVYNTYDSGNDHVRIASFVSVAAASIDGTDNDGTQLGATDYRTPSATGLSLCVATAATQAATQDVLARRAAPLTSVLGAPEVAPQGTYGSPFAANGATGWTPTAFTWQNAAIPAGTIVHWRLKYCDVTGNCGTTDEMSFRVRALSEVAAAVPTGACISTAHTCVAIPVTFTRADATPVRAYSVVVHLSPELAACGAGLVQGPYLGGSGSANFNVVNRGNGIYQVDEAILGLPCGVTGNGTLFTINLSSAAASGAGTIALDSVRVRDCNNIPVPGDAGPAASLPIDKTAPAAPTDLAAGLGSVSGGQDGRIPLAITFTPPGAGSRVEVYRKGFGKYPKYGSDLPPGAAPTAPTGYPPTGGGWTLTGVTASGQADDPPTRDYWYYVAYALDDCDNATVSALTGGTLNYFLGDVINGVTECVGNDLVDMGDVSMLGIYYGRLVGTLGAPACLDVGPTVDYAPRSLPTPDGIVEFEDLVIFALNFGATSAPGALSTASTGRRAPVAAAADAVELAVPAIPQVGETFVVMVNGSGAGDLQALSLTLDYDHAVVEMVRAEAGTLLSSQTAPAVVLSPQAGRVDVALLGRGAGLSGVGELATVRFRVLAAGDPKLCITSVDGRDAQNQKVAVARTVVSTPALPTVTRLAAATPNPFSQTTTLGFSLAQGGPVELAIYSVGGRRVRTLARGVREPGEYSLVWDGRDDGGSAMPAGVYFARLATTEASFNRTITYLK